MNTLIRLLRTRSLARGVFGGNRLWLAIAILTWGGRFARRFLAGGQPQTVFLEDLKPGERLVVAHPDAPDSKRRARRRSKKNTS